MLPSFDIVATPGAVRGSCAKAGGAVDGEAKEAELLGEITFGGALADESVELAAGVLWADAMLFSRVDGWEEIAGDVEMESDSDMDMLWHWEGSIEEKAEETTVTALLRLGVEDHEVIEDGAPPTTLLE
jgi:hypothetical protein